MKAFHGKQEIKDKYIARIKAHREAEHLTQGAGWKSNGQIRGCAVGCTLEKYDHTAYEDELGIPEWLARVEDTIFEGLNWPDDAKPWPERFLGAIKPGANVEKAKAPFLIFVLESTLDKFDHEKFPAVKKAIDQVISLYKSGETNQKKFEEAAWAAAWAAGAAWAAEEAAGAAGAARAAEEAAEAAEEAAGAARAARAAGAAWAAGYKKFADKLIEILEGIEP